MPRPWKVLIALLPFALHGLAREVDTAVGLLLKARTPPDPFLPEVVWVLAASAPGSIARVALWTFGGALLWLVLAALGGRREGRGRADAAGRAQGDPPGGRGPDEGRGFSAALARGAGSFGPLYLRPMLTVLALGSLALRPSFPYAFTLPVALGQDWGPAQDVAALAALVALRCPSLRLPPPGAAAIFLMSFLAYAFLTPEWARQWDGHPGNEPKYLRMAVAIGHELTLDAEGVSAAMEELAPRPFLEAAGRAARTLVRESVRMAGTLATGGGIGRESIKATRIARQTIRGKEGGVFYVLAPGPSVLLAPTLRLDRALNRTRGVEGRLAVSVLAWNALAAALVVALFRLVRDATGRTGLAALLALGFAGVPPFLFYGYQFYPEMPGALALALAIHRLAFGRAWTAPGAWLLGLLLATLPWLHQKFLPVWLVLVVVSLWAAVRSEAPRPVLAGLLAPQAATLYLTALYNFAIAGSVRPDALFLAWGPGGVTGARLGQGLLGLLLDARYGILPYAPLYLLAAAGLVLGGARRFALVLPAAAAYYLTVASADNWAGAVSNLGRYFMPVAPLAVALAGMAVARTSARRGALAVALVLAGWTGLLALALYHDPHAANDCRLLLVKSTLADGNQYVPNLFIRRWSDGAPGLAVRLVAWLAAGAGLALWLRRSAAGRAGGSPTRAVAGALAVVLAVGLVLERWPTTRIAPRYEEAVEVGPGVTAFVTGVATVRGAEAQLRAGEADLLVRASAPLPSLRVVVGGDGLLRLPGRAPVVARPAGALVDLPLAPRYEVRSTGETFQGVRLSVEGGVLLRFQPE